MDYKISYLLRNNTNQTISLQEAMDVTKLERKELLTKLNNFEYEMDEMFIYSSRLRIRMDKLLFE